MIAQSIVNLNKADIQNHYNSSNIHQLEYNPQNIKQSLKNTNNLNQNQDNCFQCKKNGQLYCCDNCFRSFHFECISNKKLQEIKGSSHYQKFICDNCDKHKNCTKCENNFMKKTPILSYPPNQQQQIFFKCTHCYSKIHKKCLQIPLQQLNRFNKIISDIQQLQNYPHYICLQCLQNYGIRQILKTKRINSLIKDDQLYFFVFLKTNSPIHKGWFSESVLSQHLSKVSMNQVSIDEYKSKILQPDNKIQKIILFKSSLTLSQYSFQEVLRIMQSKIEKQRNLNSQGLSNFQFLVKWKHNDYCSLTWQDESIVMKFQQLLKNFIYQQKKQMFILKNIRQRDPPSNNKSSIDQYYKIVETYLSKQMKNSQYLSPTDHKKRIYDPHIIKKFSEIDDQYSKQSFVQLIQYFQPLTDRYLSDFQGYLQQIYLKKVILRPTLIVTNNIQNWIKNKPSLLRHIIFQGRKSNVNLIKKYDYFTISNPPLFKFDLIFINYQHYIYEKQFIFSSIPSFYTVIFENIPQKVSYLVENYSKLKDKVQKQIFMIKNQIQYFHIQILSQQILKSVSPHSKKVIYHTFDFTKKKVFQRKQSKIKQIINSKYEQSLSIFQYNKQQIVIEAVRLVFLKFILAFGLNLKNPKQIYEKLCQMQPQIMKQKVQSIQKQVYKIKQYLQLFVSVVSSTAKSPSLPKNIQTINYYLFGIKSQIIFKRICQIKRLKNEIQKNKNDRSKFPFQKPFKFFCNGKLQKFPLWNIYEDYTLSALIVQIGFGRWKQICQSKSWINYHSQLQTRKVYQYDKSTNVFQVLQQIIPVSKKQINQKQQNKNGVMIVNKNDKSNQLGQTYSDYLMNKIKKASKQSKEVQFEKLLNLDILQQHLAERAENILGSLK